MKGGWEWLVPIYAFPEMKLLFPKQNYNALSPRSYTHISVRDLYISRIGLPILLTGKYVDRSWEYINRSQIHECGNWDWSCAIPRKGIHKWDFSCSGGLSSISVFPSLSPAFLWWVPSTQARVHHKMKWSRTLSLSFSPLWFKAIRALLINCLLALA